MTRYTDSSVLGFGLATIYATWLIGPLLNPDHLSVYHWAGSMPGLFLPPIFDFLVVWIALTTLVFSFQLHDRWGNLGWAFLLCFSPWFVLKNAALLRSGLPLQTLGWLLLSAGAAAFLWYVARRSYRSAAPSAATNFLATVLRFAALGGLTILVQVGWFAWQARKLNEALPNHFIERAFLANRHRPRIFWIVLDELSFQQTYGHRYSGLELPTFDRLAANGAIFSQVIAAGSSTERVLPALLTGSDVDAVRSSPDGLLSIHSPHDKSWHRFEEKDTVFSDAVSRGYVSAVAGWYNPYCRLLSSVLQQCMWALGDIDNTMEYRHSLAQNMKEPLRYELMISRSYHSLKQIFPVSDRWLLASDSHIADFQDLSSAADTLLRSPEADLVFIHMPIPHPAWIYHRQTGEFAAEKSSYLDNLALADRFLDHLERTLRQRGEWDSSTLVIMGDHGWRTRLSPDEPAWSAESDTAMQAEALNRRPAMIVILPGQSRGTSIDEPFRAVQTRKLMKALFDDQIKTGEDLHEWVRRNP